MLVLYVFFERVQSLLVCMSLRNHLRCMYLRTSRTEDVSPKNHSLEVCEKTAPGDVSPNPWYMGETPNLTWFFSRISEATITTWKHSCASKHSTKIITFSRSRRRGGGGSTWAWKVWPCSGENRPSLVSYHVSFGGFLKCWYPTTMGFPTKNDDFGVFWGYHHLRKHPFFPTSSFEWERVTAFDSHHFDSLWRRKKNTTGCSAKPPKLQVVESSDPHGQVSLETT